MYKGLQAGRAIAALLIVMVHAGSSADIFYASTPFMEFWRFGHVGVDFFFVLSGFIIYFAHARQERKEQSARTYFTKRLIRIYPPYLPISISLLVLYALFPDLSHGNRDVGILPSLLLVPTEKSPALSVSWSLMHEMLFYL